MPPRWLCTAIVVVSSCCPGFFPLLPETQRAKTYKEPTTATADDARARLLAWMKAPANERASELVTDPSSGSAVHPSGAGTFLDVTESSADQRLRGRYWGYCTSPPAPDDDPTWRLELEFEAHLADKEMALEFKRVYYAWPMLGDNPSAMTHGNRRAPRTLEDMENITRNCLDPLKKRFVDIANTAP